MSGSQLYGDREAGLCAQTDQVIQGEFINFVARDLGNTGLHNAKTPGSFHLGNCLTLHPLAERFSQFTTEEHDGCLMRREAKIEEDIIYTLYLP